MEWHRPTSLIHLLELRQEHPGAKVVVGNTELGVEVKFKHCDYPVYICPAAVKEMSEIRVRELTECSQSHMVNAKSVHIF